MINGTFTIHLLPTRIKVTHCSLFTQFGFFVQSKIDNVFIEFIETFILQAMMLIIMTVR